jgi:hypothetical protein
VNDQLSLLLRREGLGQDSRCRWFWSSLKELSDLGTSWTILRVVIITTDKARVSWFALIPIINRGSFGLLCLRIIFSLLILASPLFRFVFTGWGRLDDIYLRSLAGGSGRRRSILNIRRSRFRVVLETECDWAWAVPITPSAACEAAGVVEVLEVLGRGKSGSKS